jgi:AcrR family transcriptional regulator
MTSPSVTGTPPGLRERKKQRTREHIAQVARALFAQRGFEAVSVSEIAREADVAQKTVFNYFPTKEDLVFQRLEVFEHEMLEAIRGREVGESALDAFGRYILRPRGLLARPEPEARERLLAITAMIVESPALRARERQIFARYTDSLASLIAEEDPRVDEVEAWVAANAMIGVHRALIEHARTRLLATPASRTVARDVRRRGEKALAALRSGLGDLGVKRPD